MLGVMIDEPFNIVGQHHSNPYVLTYENNNMVLKSIKSGEHIHSWILIKIINGELDIETIEN